MSLWVNRAAVVPPLLHSPKESSSPTPSVWVVIIFEALEGCMTPQLQQEHRRSPRSIQTWDSNNTCHSWLPQTPPQTDIFIILDFLQNLHL